MNSDLKKSSNNNSPAAPHPKPKVLIVKPFHVLSNKEYFNDKNHCEKKESYSQLYNRSIENPEEFWSEIGQQLHWFKPWDKVLDNTNPPFTKWFCGGETNACFNALDRHVLAGKNSKVALIHDSPLTKTVRHVTYSELLEKVSKLAGALSKAGVKKGDRVLIYMPLIPEAIMSMLAIVRLGAIHSVVFGGFAARELCARIEHAEPKVIIAASCGIEPNKIIRYKEILNEAIEWSKHKPSKCIIFQRKNIENAILNPEIDIEWDKALKMSKPHPCVPVEANDPLYILYTSGTTDQPKGILRPTAGHIVTLALSMKLIYGLGPEAVWWAASDLGWVVGHSYICYAPLLYGITSVMYEGKPDRTPDPVPTAFRVIKREDPNVIYGRKYCLSSLKYIFVAGEHCDLETKNWAEKVFKIPVLNHYWQTETGHSITASCMGFADSVNIPKHSCGKPFFGFNVKVLRKDGSEALPLELGRIAVKLPLPPGTMLTLYKASEIFRKTYFTKYPGYYDTMDAGYFDENGFFFITARDDDIINVAGHRLSTSALEDVILSHPDVIDATVVGVPESTKGEIPLCSVKSETIISRELICMIRESIGPIASFRLAVAVSGLPRTRSGKTCRKSIADMAKSKVIKISSTVENPAVYTEILLALKQLGFALNAPEPN